MLATLVTMALPRPWDGASSIGLSLVIVLQIRLLAAVGSSATSTLVFRVLGFLTLSGLWLWLLTPVGLRNSGLPLLVILVLFEVQAYPRLVTRLSLEKRVTGDVLTGAIAGYLLLGLTAALVVALLESVQPGSFSGFTSSLSQEGADPDMRSIENVRFIHLTYYAFVTLSTLGYGDMLPITPLAKLWTIMFSVIGPVYLAVLMGVLIGRYIQQEIND